jgi:VanZ family protein
MAGLLLRRLIRPLCVAYWLFLTVLLVVPHPEATVGLKKIPWYPLGDIGIHFSAFCALTVLVFLARWPRPVTWRWILFLAAYGATTETVQAFVPCRSCELKDYVDNFLGVAAGTGIYWIVYRTWQIRTRRNIDAASSSSTDSATADQDSIRT